MLSTPLKRRTRRLLSVAAVVMLLANFLAGLFGERFRILTWLLFIPYIFIVFWLNRTTANVVWAKDRKLDERQRGLRDRAYRLTYMVLVLYAFLMVSVDFFGFGSRYIPFGASSSPVISLLLLVNSWLLITLPILYVAWLEPDPITEFEERTLA